MPISILMPALSPTMVEGNLARWLVKEGDAIKPGMVIAEIETDKATMEVEAVDEGRIGKIIVPAGAQAIAVNSTIALLLEDGESELTEVPLAAPVKTIVPNGNGGEKNRAALVSELPPSALSPAKPANAANGARIMASPLAKRIAHEAGLDIRLIKGSGPNGRIVRADVELAKVNGASQSAAAKPISSAAAAVPAVVAKPAAGMDAKALANALGQRYRTESNSGIRKVIARRLLESKLTVPHFYLSLDCRIDALLELRSKLNALHDKNKISVNDFVIRAVALALLKVPAANAAWTDEEILQYEQADISVAVATPNGLITPIIKGAESKSVSIISAEMKDLAARARVGKLKPEEFQGGGFSISNLGMYGIKQFSAIINPPQACILAVGAGEQRPIVANGQIVVGTIMNCTLSVDHRAVDGAVGAEFLAAFKALLEDPLALLS